MEETESAELIQELCDTVATVIECPDCHKKIAEYALDVYELAEHAYEQGWRVSQSGQSICPKCIESQILCAQCGTAKGETKSKYNKTLDNDDWVCSKKCHREYALDYFGYGSDK